MKGWASLQMHHIKVIKDTMRSYFDTLLLILFCLLFSCHCSTLAFAASVNAQYLQATMGSYPGSNSTSNGFVIIKFDLSSSSSSEETDDLTIFMDMSSITPNCTVENNVTNGCGVHIHVGTDTCTNATAVGGHYWNPKIYGEVDPWLSVKYLSDSSGRSEDVIHMRGGDGFNASENNHHNIILHDASGARVACGVLSIIEWNGDNPNVDNSSAITTTTTVTVNSTTTVTTTVYDD